MGDRKPSRQVEWSKKFVGAQSAGGQSRGTHKLGERGCLCELVSADFCRPGPAGGVWRSMQREQHVQGSEAMGRLAVRDTELIGFLSLETLQTSLSSWIWVFCGYLSRLPVHQPCPSPPLVYRTPSIFQLQHGESRLIS